MRERHQKKTLSPEEIVAIRIAAKLGVGPRHIARVTGIPRSTVHRIMTEQSFIGITSRILSIYEDA